MSKLSKENVQTTQEILDIISAEMTKRGITQDDLAEHLGLSRSRITHILTKRFEPRTELILSICSYLNIEVNLKRNGNEKP